MTGSRPSTNKSNDSSQGHQRNVSISCQRSNFFPKTKGNGFMTRIYGVQLRNLEQFGVPYYISRDITKPKNKHFAAFSPRRSHIIYQATSRKTHFSSSLSSILSLKKGICFIMCFIMTLKLWQ